MILMHVQFLQFNKEPVSEISFKNFLFHSLRNSSRVIDHVFYLFFYINCLTTKNAINGTTAERRRGAM